MYSRAVAVLWGRRDTGGVDGRECPDHCSEYVLADPGSRHSSRRWFHSRKRLDTLIGAPEVRNHMKRVPVPPCCGRETLFVGFVLNQCVAVKNTVQLKDPTQCLVADWPQF